MRTVPVLVAVTALLGLTACDRKEKIAPPAAEVTDNSGMATPKGFTHDAKVGVGGTYRPKDEVLVGHFRLGALAIGGADTFEAWEDGQRLPDQGPVVLVFEDTTPPVQPAAPVTLPPAPPVVVTVRVLPTSYHVTKAAMAFHGKDATLGAVTFAGAFNQTALRLAKSGAGGEASVLKGDLQVGDKRFSDVAFTYSTGE